MSIYRKYNRIFCTCTNSEDQASLREEGPGDEAIGLPVKCLPPELGPRHAVLHSNNETTFSVTFPQLKLDV